MNKSDILYKVIMSISLGIISYMISINPIIYHIDGQVTSIHVGILLPLLISMAWGWKYGLLSCTFGLGTQYGWSAWSSSGWLAAFGVTTHTLWVMFHGWWESKKCCFIKDNEDCWYKPYIGELLFRIVIVSLYFLLSDYIMSFNPPFWNPEATITEAKTHFIQTVMMKQSLDGLMWLVVCDLLLMIRTIRSIFKLNNDSYQSFRVIPWVCFIGVVLVSIEAFAEAHVYQKEFLETLIYPSLEYFIHRVIAFSLCLAFGLFIAKDKKKYNKLRRVIEAQNEKYCQYFEELPIPIMVVNVDGYIIRISSMLRNFIKMTNKEYLELLTKQKKCEDYFETPICGTDKCVLKCHREEHYNSEFLMEKKGAYLSCCVSIIHSITNSEGELQEMLVMYEIDSDLEETG